MESIGANSCKFWPLGDAQKHDFVRFFNFKAPPSGQKLQLLVPMDSKFYGEFNQYQFVTQTCI